MIAGAGHLLRKLLEYLGRGGVNPLIILTLTYFPINQK